MLTLMIEKKWFDMILSGEKTEEYRELKRYYDSRFRNAAMLKNQEYPANVSEFRNLADNSGSGHRNREVSEWLCHGCPVFPGRLQIDSRGRKTGVGSCSRDRVLYSENEKREEEIA